MALDQLGKNSQELSGLQLEVSSQHQGHLDTREAALQAREAEIKGITNCVLLVLFPSLPILHLFN